MPRKKESPSIEDQISTLNKLNAKIDLNLKGQTEIGEIIKEINEKGILTISDQKDISFLKDVIAEKIQALEIEQRKLSSTQKMQLFLSLRKAKYISEKDENTFAQEFRKTTYVFKHNLT